MDFPSSIQPLGGPGSIKLDPDLFKQHTTDTSDFLSKLTQQDDFEPQTRARSNTWPHSRPEDPPFGVGPTGGIGPNCVGQGGPTSSILNENGIDIVSQGLLGFPKKSTSRRNAWGNLSYADLITQAISSSPDKRLTLSQIYDWMVTNVPYFKDKGDSNSSAGWKNSIRHNLSLHNRFMRVQNEGTGKSSWWMLNPDAKPGKAARRRATSMETSKFEKKRGRIKKKLEAVRNGLALDTPSPASSLSEGLDLFPESPHVPTTFNLSPSDFRTRANSNASSCAGRLSPILGEVDITGGSLGSLSGHLSANDALSNWDTFTSYAYGSPRSVSLLDPFGAGGSADQLAVGVANTLKLAGESPGTGGSGGGQQQQQQQQSNYGRNSDPYHSQFNSSPQNFGNNGTSASPNNAQGQQQYRSSPGIQQQQQSSIPTTIRQNDQSGSQQQQQNSEMSEMRLPLLNGIYGGSSGGQQQSVYQPTKSSSLFSAISAATNPTNNSIATVATILHAHHHHSGHPHAEFPVDFNLDLDSNTFECNVDEVLQAELNLGEGIDFNFGGHNNQQHNATNNTQVTNLNGANHNQQQSHPGLVHQNQNVSVSGQSILCPPSQSAYSPAATMVVHHQPPTTTGRQWTSVLH